MPCMKFENSLNKNNIFVSCIIVPDKDSFLSGKYLENTCHILDEKFDDFELIIIRSQGDKEILAILDSLPQKYSRNIIIVNLSRTLDRMNALVAGLDIANGDYIINIDPLYEENPDCIIEMFNLTQHGNDVVQLVSKVPHNNFFQRILEKTFTMIYNKLSSTKLPYNLHESFIISRRALNSMLEMRESIRFLNGLISYVGFRKEYVYKKIQPNPNKNFKDHLHSYKIGLVSFTDMLSKILLTLFLCSFIGGSLIILNALFVKFLGYDILGNKVQFLPIGWTFIIIFMAIIFIILFLSMYIMSLYISSMHSESKKRPLYIIESIERYTK